MISLDLVTRSDFGKGSAKKLRREGLVPCVVSSPELGAIPVSAQKKMIEKLVQSPSFLSTVFEAEISKDGKKQKMQMIVSNVDFHPVKSNVLHIDFTHTTGKTVVVQVPVKILGADKSAGLKKGGKLNLVKYHLPLECEINSIPENIGINISSFGVGRSLFLSRIELPQGVKMAYDCLILSITGRGRKEKAEDDAAAAVTAAAATAKPAAAKPAAKPAGNK
jgi:large subunit ribosomal protein L25